MIVETTKGKLPVRYGMNALAHFGDLTGKTMNVVMKSLGDLGKLSSTELLAFLYVGFVDGARFAKVDCVIQSPEELGDMIDDDEALIAKVTAVFVGEAEEAEESKKK